MSRTYRITSCKWSASEKRPGRTLLVRYSMADDESTEPQLRKLGVFLPDFLMAARAWQMPDADLEKVLLKYAKEYVENRIWAEIPLKDFEDLVLDENTEPSPRFDPA
jgi:hypothetical protein